MPFTAENTANFLCNIGVLATHELAARLDNRHPAAEPAVRLSHLDTDVTAAEYDQVRRQIVELQTPRCG